DVDYFALKDWGVPDFCQLIFITSPEIIEKRKKSFQSFMNIVRKAIDFIYDNPEEAKKIYHEYTNADPTDELNNAIMEATIPCFTYDFSMTADYYDELQHWLKETGKIDKVIDPN